MQSGCSTSTRASGKSSPLSNPASILTAILTAAILLLSMLAPQSAQAQDDAATTSLSAEAQEIVHAINRVRAANGLPTLRAHALLNQAAQNHVDDLIANGLYGHYGSDGSNVRTRVSRTGYPSLWVSENWVTSQSVEGAMNWWMNDWIHRVNILDSKWDEVGVGVGKVSNGWWIFVTDFANADGKDTSVAVPPVQVAAAQPALVSSVPAGGTEYTVQSGDTLMAIGLRFGIEWQDIAVANSLGEYDILNIGRKLHIPGIATADTAATADVPEGGLLYTVQSGDTLSGIASRYKIGWSDIAAANKLGEYTILQIGMQIRLPGVPEAGAATDSSATNNAASNASANSASSDAPDQPSTAFVGNSGGIPYTIKPGDTLFTIAARNNVTWQDLASTNGLNENSLLQIGQTIHLPGSQPANMHISTGGTGVSVSNSLLPTPTVNAAGFEARSSAVSLPTATPTIVITTTILPVATPRPGAQSSAQNTGRTYTVQSGDTVIGIATRLGVDWRTLLSANGLGENSILSLGQVLTVP